MSLINLIERVVDNPLTSGGRAMLALILSPIIFYLGLQKYSRNDLMMPFWQRDFSDMWHGISGLGNTKTAVMELPAGVIGLIAAVIVGFLLLKGLAKYPKKINIHLLSLLILDFLVIAVLVNIFLFSGSAFEILYYAGAFIAGIYLFGDRVTSQMALIAAVVLVLVRLVYIESMYLHVFWIPVLSLVYLILRAPFESESYQEELKHFSFSRAIGRS